METDLIIKKAAQDAGVDAVRRTANETLKDCHVQPAWLNTKDAAIYLGLSTQFLEIGRHKGYGPAYYRLMRDGIRRGTVRYKRSDLDAWMADQSVQPGA